MPAASQFSRKRTHNEPQSRARTATLTDQSLRCCRSDYSGLRPFARPPRRLNDSQLSSAEASSLLNTPTRRFWRRSTPIRPVFPPPKIPKWSVRYVSKTARRGNCDGRFANLDVQNGGYINPPRIKRQFRDPHANWWDPQERRNFGEPVHEDNDVLGMFSPWQYTWTTAGPGLVMIGTFVVTFLSVSAVVYTFYPDMPAYPREFPGGLERELGGPGAVRVSTVP